MRGVIQCVGLMSAVALLWAGTGQAQTQVWAAHQPAVVGAFPAPPAGAGPGVIALWSPVGSTTIRYAPANTLAGNSFYVGVDPARSEVFVPTLAGRTDVVSLRTGKAVTSFPSLPGGRVARYDRHQHLLLVLSGKALAAYQPRPPFHQVFRIAFGGNAIALSPEGRRAFVGGNMDRVVEEIGLPSGTVERTFPVRRSGDLVFARGQVFSADIETGVMTAIHVRSGRVVKMATPEVDPNFSYSNIPAATAGFMQVATSPNRHWVYAVGFSGHILKFSAVHDRYVGEVAVNLPGTAPRKLSGLAVLWGGNEAVITVENRKETVVVDLATGNVLHTVAGIASNRWVLLPGRPA